MAAINQLTLAPGGVTPDIVKGSIFFIGNATVLIRYAGIFHIDCRNLVFFNHHQG